MDFDSTDTIRRMAEADVPTSPPPRTTWDKVRDIGRTIDAADEVAISLGTGLFAQPLGVIGAALDTANKYASGRGSEVDFEKSMGDIAQFFTYQPRSDQAQEMLHDVGSSGAMQSLNALGAVAHTLPPLRTAPSPKSFRPDPITAHAAEQAVLPHGTPSEVLKQADYHALIRSTDPIDPLALAVQEHMPPEMRPRSAPGVPPIDRDANFKAWFAGSKIVNEDGTPMVRYHGTSKAFDSFDPAAVGRSSGNDGWKGEGFYFGSADLASGYATKVVDGDLVVPRDGGNVMPVYLAIRNPLELNPETYRQVAELPQWTHAERMAIINNSGKLTGEISGKRIREVAEANGHDGIVANYGAEVVAFKPEQIKSAIGNSGRFDPASASLTDRMPRETIDAAMAHNLTESAERLRPPEAMPEPVRMPEPVDVAPVEPVAPRPRAGQEIVDRAMAERVKLEEGGKPIDEHLQASKLAPEVQNLLIGLHESGKDGARAARLIDDFVRSVEANPKRPMQDIAADVVEASRRNAEVTPKPGGDPMAASNRVQGLDPSREMPNFDGEAVRVGDEMERVQRVAREGTADELGAIDADLLRVAAECALTVGAP